MKLYLLGAFEAFDPADREIVFRSNRERALLIYLSIENDRPHRRETLASILWPETSDPRAKSNLRVTIHRLRQAVEGVGLDVLDVSRSELRLHPDHPIWTDYGQLCDAVTRSQYHKHDDRSSCKECMNELADSIALYRGPFLQGFNLEDSQFFSEWVLIKQEWLHREMLDALYDLSDFYFLARELERATQFARRQIDLEPWREKAHRQLMRVLAERGERTAAMAQYESCQSTILEELAIEPSPETTELYEQIRDGRYERLLETGNYPSPGKPPPDVPPVLETLDSRSPLSPLDDPNLRSNPRNAPAAIDRETQLEKGSWSSLGTFWEAVWNRKAIPYLVGIILIAVSAAYFIRGSGEAFYDSFDTGGSQNSFDPARWVIPSAQKPSSCIFSVADGVLTITTDPLIPPFGCSARVARPILREGSALGELGVRMRASADGWSTGMSVGLRASASMDGGDWSVDCGLNVDGARASIVFSVSDTRLSNPSQQGLYTSAWAIDFDTWYDIQLQINPDTFESVCLIDGDEIGRYTPDSAADLQSASFFREIIGWHSGRNSGSIFMDDYYIKEGG